VLHGNQLIVLSDNEKQQFIAGYDKVTGKQLWRTNRDIGQGTGPDAVRSGWSTPYVWTNPIRTEIVTIGPGETVSYDLEGKELWRMPGVARTPIASPFAHDGLLYIDNGAGKAITALKPGASGKVADDFIAWSADRAGTYLPTPVLYDGGVYALTERGILSRYDAKTGKVSFKARIDKESGYFTTSPWAYQGKIFCLNEEGKTFVLAAGEELKVLHTNELNDMAQATPALVGDRLLLRTEHTLYSIRALN
jgi:outer membrane protein assembly factor BamB